MNPPPHPLVSTPPGTSRAALASFVLGLASVGLLLLAITGLPALYFGVLGLRAVNASEGKLRGARLALAGMVLGGLGSLLTLVGLAAIVFLKLGDGANRMECRNHLRLLGQGLARHHEAQGAFPAAVLDPATAAGLPPEERLSWLAALLPYLGEGKTVSFFQDLHGKLDPRRPWSDPANAADQLPVRIFLCPGHPDLKPTLRPGPTHYVGLAGIDPDAIRLPRSSPRAGMFGYDRGVRLAEVSQGISFTMMVAETAWHNGPWAAAGDATVRGVAPNGDRYLGPGEPFGGLHPGGANILWVDGSVRWVGESVEAAAFRRQVLLRDEEPVER